MPIVQAPVEVASGAVAETDWDDYSRERHPADWPEQPPVPITDSEIPTKDGAPAIGIPNTSRTEWPCARVNTAPEIDGVLDEDIWRKAYDVELTDRREQSLNNPSVAAIAHDGTNMYIGAIAMEPEMDKLKINCRKRDQHVYGDDCFEIYIDSRAGGNVKICVNPDGVIADFARGGMYGDINWDINVKTAKFRNAWTFEMAIPCRHLFLKNDPEPGMGFNIMRMRQNDIKLREYGTWKGWINQGPIGTVKLVK